MSKSRFLAAWGDTLIGNGYNITPIQVGAKYPPHDGWSKIKATKAKLADWLLDGITFERDDEERTVDVSDAGVGIITRDTPGVDIDVSHDEIAKALEEFVHYSVGMAPVRVGRAPRRLLLFRCDKPFHKVQSGVYLDEFDEPQKVEILADGQQFVAFHIHPDTHKPYQWLYKDGPHITHADDLPTIDEDDARAIVAEFERLAEKAGWRLKKKARENKTAKPGKPRVIDEDDPFADVKQKALIAPEELREKLMSIPDNADHDTWFQVGMALYHQFDGDADGLALWHEWSESAHNYDASALDKRWESFDIQEKGREPLTARYIIKLAAEAVAQENREEAQAIVDLLNEAETIEAFESACKSAKRTDLDKLSHERVLNAVKQAYRRLNGHAVQVKTARDLIRFENPNYLKNKPEWMEGWVYLENQDAFYNTASQSQLSITGFNAAFNRYMLTKAERMEGRAKPESQAADAALNTYEMTLVRGTMYLPDADPVFTMNGVRYANTFSDKSMPRMPKKYSAADLKAIAIVEEHFSNLIESERDRGLALSWLSYVARERKHPKWALLIQGPEGNGKSTIAKMMGMILGPENVKMISPATLEGSNFTAWATGGLLGVVEEMKLHGHNKHDVMNKLKDKITNDIIEVHAKGRDAISVVNTMAYLMFTNFRDAVPIGDNDTRIFPIFSRIQTASAMRSFNMHNPLYFTRLHRAIENQSGGLRRWLCEITPHEDFDPRMRATESVARKAMIAVSKSAEEEILDELMAERKREDFSPILLNATAVREEIMEIAGVPNAAIDQRLKQILLNRGFEYLGRVQVDGMRSRFWSSEPARFRQPGTEEICRNRVEAWISDAL
jgi:energy-coupling factor transporter ATP-binding protein EcfA2